MDKNSIDFPSIEPFRKYVFDPFNIGDYVNSDYYRDHMNTPEKHRALEYYGYGVPFDGKQYSKILNDKE